MLLKPKVIVTVDIFYFLPDYPSLIEEFVWQTRDYWPETPRVNKFLWYWVDNIDAVINEVFIQHSEECKWKHINIEQRIK